MNCPDCGSENTAVFHIEDFPCRHCSTVNEISYNICYDCRLSFKEADGEVIAATRFPNKELIELANLSEEDVKIVVKDEVDSEHGRTMGEVIHRCLRCEAIAFEVEENSYKCFACDFEWETI
jgi:hypothetical protein